MRKLTLRSEHLGELTTDQLRQVAGGVGEARTVSDGSCVCHLSIQFTAVAPLAACDVSDGSCVCNCPPNTNG